MATDEGVEYIYLTPEIKQNPVTKKVFRLVEGGDADNPKDWKRYVAPAGFEAGDPMASLKAVKNFVDPGTWAGRLGTGGAVAGPLLAAGAMSGPVGWSGLLAAAIAGGLLGGGLGGLADEPTPSGAMKGAAEGGMIALTSEGLAQLGRGISQRVLEKASPLLGRFAKAAAKTIGLSEKELPLEKSVQWHNAFNLEDQPGGMKHAYLEKYKALFADIHSHLPQGENTPVPPTLLQGIGKEHFPEPLKTRQTVWEKELEYFTPANGQQLEKELEQAELNEEAAKASATKSANPKVMAIHAKQVQRAEDDLTRWHAGAPPPPEATFKDVWETSSNLRKSAYDNRTGDAKDTVKADRFMDLHRELNKRGFAYIEGAATPKLATDFAQARHNLHYIEDLQRIYKEARGADAFTRTPADMNVMRGIYFKHIKDLREPVGEAGEMATQKALWPGYDNPAVSTGETGHLMGATHLSQHGLGQRAYLAGRMGQAPRSTRPTLTGLAARGLSASQLAKLIDSMHEEQSQSQE